MTLRIPFVMMILVVHAQPIHSVVYSCNSAAACGCSSAPATMTKIVGGETAATSTWGWAVSLSINGDSLCGGSILSRQWIITAAHCVNGVRASRIAVYAGSNTKYSGQSRKGSTVTVHPSYDSGTEENDLALIQLATPLNMTDPNVAIICMPYVTSATLAAGEWPPANLNVAAVGWGDLSEGGSTSTTLQQVTLQTIDYRLAFCSDVLNNEQEQLCAGVIGGGKDTCQGDSGGPLMMFTSSNQWALVGLTSYGTGCARNTSAGVYTRIAFYLDWIQTTTGNAVTNATLSNPASSGPSSTATTTAATTTTTTALKTTTTTTTAVAIMGVTTTPTSTTRIITTSRKTTGTTSTTSTTRSSTLSLTPSRTPASSVPTFRLGSTLLLLTSTLLIFCATFHM